MTLWSGRFDTAPDPAAFDFGVSFGFDRVLFEDDVTGSIDQRLHRLERAVHDHPQVGALPPQFHPVARDS